MLNVMLSLYETLFCFSKLIPNRNEVKMIVTIRFKNAKNIIEKDTICESVYFAKTMALK